MNGNVNFMGKYVNDVAARTAHDRGIKIGETEPSRETKYSWWEVYKWSDYIIACVMTENGVTCGEEILMDELHLYVDDIKSAKNKLINK
jgi:hypothetical protein